MAKRNLVPTSLLSLFALAALCVFAADGAAQKTPNTVAGAPLKGVDVKLGRNPGGGAQTRKTDNDGKIDLGDLVWGKYWLEIVSPSKDGPTLGTAVAGQEGITAASGESYPYIAVTISGTTLVGGTKTRSLKIKEWKFVNPPPKNTVRTATPVEMYTDRIEFEIDPGKGPTPEPLQVTIKGSRSNIYNH